MLKKEERIVELHHALTMLDQEHDTLRSEADSKAENLDHLNQQIKDKDGCIEEFERHVRELETELSGSREDNGRKDVDLQSLRQQVELARRETEQLRGQLTTITQHEEQLRQDLSTMTQVCYYNECSQCFQILGTLARLLSLYCVGKPGCT